MRVLFLLFAAHVLFDFQWQGDFLSHGKNRFKPIPGIPWYQCMFAHCLIHAVAVGLITNSGGLAVCEFLIHFWADDSKCAGKLSFNQDQAIHYGCKLLWASVAWLSLHLV
jgi:hypothetical protein